MRVGAVREYEYALGDRMPDPARWLAGLIAVLGAVFVMGAPAAQAQSTLSVSSPSVVEGNSGQTALQFTVSGQCDPSFACTGS